MSLQAAYQRNLLTVSDIHEHLPFLRYLAGNVRRVAEFGIRTGVSSSGLLMGLLDQCLEGAQDPMVYLGVDHHDCHKVLDDLKVGIPGNVLVQFLQHDTTNMPVIPEVELLMIDTVHTAAQLEQELSLHLQAVARYVVLHDTELYGLVGEKAGSRGLMFGIGELGNPAKWRKLYHNPRNNGLTAWGRK